MAQRDGSQPATPWALTWLAGTAAVCWIALLLADGPLRPAGRAQQLVQQVPPVSTRPAAPLVPPPLQPSALHLPSLQAASKTTARPPTLRPAADAGPMLASSLPVAMAPTDLTPTPISSSLLLGGPITLSNLGEKTMIPAARIEKAIHAASGDPLQAIPLHWRNHMQALMEEPAHVLPAEVVRLPAPHLQQPEEIPMVVKASGVAETTIQPSSSHSMQTLERWAERQDPVAQGSVRPRLVVLEPIAPDSKPIQLPARLPTDIQKSTIGNIPSEALTFTEPVESQNRLTRITQRNILGTAKHDTE